MQNPGNEPEVPLAPGVVSGYSVKLSDLSLIRQKSSLFPLVKLVKRLEEEEAKACFQGRKAQHKTGTHLLRTKQLKTHFVCGRIEPTLVLMPLEGSGAKSLCDL